jgi:hypothetical protein
LRDDGEDGLVIINEQNREGLSHTRSTPSPAG